MSRVRGGGPAAGRERRPAKRLEPGDVPPTTAHAVHGASTAAWRQWFARLEQEVSPPGRGRTGEKPRCSAKSPGAPAPELPGPRWWAVQAGGFAVVRLGWCVVAREVLSRAAPPLCTGGGEGVSGERNIRCPTRQSTGTTAGWFSARPAPRCSARTPKLPVHTLREASPGLPPLRVPDGW